MKAAKEVGGIFAGERAVIFIFDVAGMSFGVQFVENF